MACMAFSYSDVLLGWHMYFSDFTKTKMQDDFLLPPPPPPHNLPAPPPLKNVKYVNTSNTLNTEFHNVADTADISV